MLLKKKKNSSPNKRDELAHILDRRWTQVALSLAGIHGNSTGDCQYIKLLQCYSNIILEVRGNASIRLQFAGTDGKGHLNKLCIEAKNIQNQDLNHELLLSTHCIDRCQSLLFCNDWLLNNL